jgi:hypothetical protein
MDNEHRKERVTSPRPEDTGQWRVPVHARLEGYQDKWYEARCAFRGRYERDSVAQRIAERMYYLKANERTREAVFYVAKALEQLLSQQRYDSCKEFLSIVSKDLDSISLESIGSILTATFIAKPRLGVERETFYQVAFEHYVRRVGPDQARRLLLRLT